MGPGPAPRPPHTGGFPPDSFAARNAAPPRDPNMMRNPRPMQNPNRPPYPQGQQQQRPQQRFQQWPQRPQQRPNRISQGAPAPHPSQMHQRPSAYDRPRPSSSSSSGSTVASQESIDVAMASPTSSHSSFTSFDSLDASPRKPDNGWQRPAPIKQNRVRRSEGELFAALPDEVLLLILDNLKKHHIDPKSDSCATCMMRDLCSVASASRRWLELARVAL